MMRLKNLQLGSNLFLAPMAGISDFPFRQLAREHGCGLTFTEMVSAEGLLRKGEPFAKMVKGEHPVSVQLFGSRPVALAEAAARVEALGADAIDLNMGCPAKQVVKTEAGADLMRFPEKVKEILNGMRKKIACPLSVKIRSGWDENQINAVEISKLAEDCGVDAITVHPRTKVQAFRGEAHWDIIAAVKGAVRIPVIGNGDIVAPFMIEKMLAETGCDGVMIGRGSLGNPWIFDWKGSGPKADRRDASVEEIKRMIDHHGSLVLDHYGEKAFPYQFRKHLYWYTKGLPGCAAFHSKLSGLRTKEAVFDAIHDYFNSLPEKGPSPLPIPEEGRSMMG